MEFGVELGVILTDSDSNGYTDEEDRPVATRQYREMVNFDFGGEEFRMRYRLSSEAAKALLGLIGPHIQQRRGVGVRAADMQPKQKLVV